MKKTSRLGMYFPGARWQGHWDVLNIPRDIYREVTTFVHRGMYGWAPRDVWNLDHYLETVLSGTLDHLAKTTHGRPVDEQKWPTHATWTDYLARVAADIDRYHELKYGMEEDYDEELKAYEKMVNSIKGLTNWWGNLWD